MMTKEGSASRYHPGLDRILRAAVTHDFPVKHTVLGQRGCGQGLIDRHPNSPFHHRTIWLILHAPHATRPAAAVGDLPRCWSLPQRKNA